MSEVRSSYPYATLNPAGTHAMSTESPAAPAAIAPPARRWTFAIVIAFAAAAILYDTNLGINWPILVALGAAGILATARDMHGRAGSPSIVAVCWALVLASGVAITAGQGTIALLVLSSVFFLAVAMTAAGHTSLSALRPRLAIIAPFAAFLGGFAAFISEITYAFERKQATRRNVALRSIVITLPIICILIALLGDADPLFARLRVAMEELVPLDEPGRIAFFFFALAVSIGALGSVARASVDSTDATPFAGFAIGQVESRTLVAGMAAVMWLFVASASYSMTQNPAARAGSGITFAQYAHQGFAEVNVAAALVIGVILATRRTWKREDSLLWRTATLAIAGVGAMLVIAFMRLVAYEQAYGFTFERLLAQGVMLVLACMLVLLAFETMQRAASHRFAYRATTAALTLGMASVYFNTDAWIVRRNLELYKAGGKLDVDYLVYSLSADAMPEVFASLTQLRAPESDLAVTALCVRYSNSSTRDSRWFAWNLRATRAEVARAKWFAGPHPACPTPHADH
jgi:two-component system sensor histidine kinase BaeS